MEGKADSQGQGANLNGNDRKKHFERQQLNLEENLPLEGCNFSPIEKNIDKNTLRGNKTSGDLNLEGGMQAQVTNETIDNNSELPSNRISVELDNQKTEGMDAVEHKHLENEPRLIVCEMVDDDMCITRAVDKNETNCNMEDSPSEKHDDMQINSEDTQNGTLVLNNNEKPDGSAETQNSVENTVYPSENLETADAHRSTEVLAKEVTKLNISAEEKKIKETPSKVVVNMQSESLKSLMAYDGDSNSEHSDSDPQTDVCDLSNENKENNSNTKKTWRKNENNGSGTSDSECDSSASTLSLESDSDVENSDGDSASVIDASDDGIRIDSSVVNKSSDKGAVKKKNPNILDLEEFLPPLPDLSKLNINLDEAEFMHIGRISAIISDLVTVTANPGTPAFDLDSILFVDDQTAKKPIGPIYDVLGPVTEPIYCIRFNNEKEVVDLGLKSGMRVYAIPKSEEFTKYVFVQELMKIKGSDASWYHDQETPLDHAEFSDDEKERESRRAKKTNKRKLNDGSLERHKRYERTMNQCNSLNTRVCRLMDVHKSLSKHIKPNTTEDIKPPTGCPELPPIPPPLFDPTVPPPGFGQPTLYSVSTQPPVFNSSAGFGQSPGFNNSLSPYNNQTGVPGSLFGAPVMFGHHYANEPPSPQNLCPPPARWSWKDQRDEFRRPHRSNNPRSNHQNSDNYFTNNGRNFRGAGPSSQPF